MRLAPLQGKKPSRPRRSGKNKNMQREWSAGPASLRKRRRYRRILASALFTALSTSPGAFAAEPAPEDLADLSLEQLGSIDITSVSRKKERLIDAAASVFVITSEDIRRSGVTSLPEALRLAPNLEVSRVNSNSYAISARGFNNSVGNKLLVLVDGRTVYTPLFSGVFWDTQDIFMPDVERIEVISGPGGTLWGTNAVNGVINVITRRSADTQGGLAVAGGGNTERGYGVRYGAALGEKGTFRVYGKSFDRDSTSRENQTQALDAWDKGQIGFRADWGSAADGFTLQGDGYRGDIDQAGDVDTRLSGGNLVARWTRALANGGHFQVQTYFDNAKREMAGSITERLNTYDIEFQHGLGTRGDHAVIWGGGYRNARDHVENTFALAFLPADKNLEWANLFIQDELALHTDLKLIAGIRVEHNPYTGLEVLPSARLAWKPAPEHLLWTAVSRAVRSPSRLDRELFAPSQPPFLLAGGPDFESEVSDVLEAGYRAKLSAKLSYSLTVFHHIYDHLRSIEPNPGGGFVLANRMQGTGTGAEAWASFQATKYWQLSAGGFVLHQDLELEAGSGNPGGTSAAGNDPDYQWALRSSLDLPYRTALDIWVRHVAELPNPVVPAYTAVDARLGWQARSDVELSLTIQNMFDPQHPEFGTPGTRSEVERAVYAQILWRF
jgi:iron complex outermembrane receptor protein